MTDTITLYRWTSTVFPADGATGFEGPGYTLQPVAEFHTLRWCIIHADWAAAFIDNTEIRCRWAEYVNKAKPCKFVDKLVEA